MDNEATEKTAIIERPRRTRPTPQRMVVEVAKTTGPGPGRITRRPISSRFLAHNVRDHGQDRSRWSRVGPKKGNEPSRIGNPPL